MDELELRELIGSRIRKRRTELKLSQKQLAEKLGINRTTILRYENGSIDNTKKFILESLAEALQVSADWLSGKSDEYQTTVNDNQDIVIQDLMKEIFQELPTMHDLAENRDENEIRFTKNMLIMMLRNYQSFQKAFLTSCDKYKSNAGDTTLAENMGLSSGIELNEILFLRELMPSINTLADMSDILRLYSKNPEASESRLNLLLKDSD